MFLIQTYIRKGMYMYIYIIQHKGLLNYIYMLHAVKSTCNPIQRLIKLEHFLCTCRQIDYD